MTSRLVAIEAKAIGILQAAGVVAAGAFVACADDGLAARSLGIVSLVYLCACGIAACTMLVPAQRSALTPEDIGREDGYATVAAASESLTPVGIRSANLVTSAAYDLTRGLAAALPALLLVVF